MKFFALGFMVVAGLLFLAGGYNEGDFYATFILCVSMILTSVIHKDMLKKLKGQKLPTKKYNEAAEELHKRQIENINKRLHVLRTAMTSSASIHAIACVACFGIYFVYGGLIPIIYIFVIAIIAVFDMYVLGKLSVVNEMTKNLEP